MRYLVHHDLQRELFELCAEFYMQHEERFYTEFNYIGGELKIDVLPTSDHQSKHAKEDAPRQIHEFARLARSAGTMQLHVAAIANAGFGGYICCPMRSEVRKSFDALALLADRRLEGAITYEMYGELIKGLTEEVSEGVMEVHQPIFSWIIRV
ncbi:hypothetical protein B0H10DRAFT_1954616 [Mycena sp. CBHHK59/15]|nr:hypothetical protein B0H10DRAFT_1954616 [Mycena sp. CBHHK59/15]